MFIKAVVREPGDNFADGLTTSGLGIPDYEKALEQHRKYCEALEKCGLTVLRLPAVPGYPDSTFVEDTAIVTKKGAILTRPGAISREGEVTGMKEILTHIFPSSAEIAPPGTLDGGDICEADGRFFIGLSKRTNEVGGRQLADWLDSIGYKSFFVDIRATAGILHLKSGIAYIGDNRLAVIEMLAGRPEFEGFELIRMASGEEYAANCLRINDYVLIADGFPIFEATLRKLGYRLIVLDMSEFRKMDGGLSCLSLRF
jgi:dimethylargininase